MAAARAWVAGQLDAAPAHMQPDQEAIADARRWGASPAEIEGLRQHLMLPGGDGVAVWHCNVETVSAFLVAGTQWRTTNAVTDGQLRTHWIGLDYVGARVSIVESGMHITPDLWAGLRVMEAAARDALNGVTVH